LLLAACDQVFPSCPNHQTLTHEQCHSHHSSEQINSSEIIDEFLAIGLRNGVEERARVAL